MLSKRIFSLAVDCAERWSALTPTRFRILDGAKRVEVNPLHHELHESGPWFPGVFQNQSMLETCHSDPATAGEESSSRTCKRLATPSPAQLPDTWILRYAQDDNPFKDTP
jgi:hypothetical protein